VRHIRLLAVVVPVLAGCAKIQQFEVRPLVACPGDQVHVSWQASGSLTLDPPLEGRADLPSTGSADVTVNPPAQFTLRAHRLFKSASAEADVELAPAKDEGFAEPARCDEANRRLETTFVLDLQLASGVEVERICNPSERELIATKDGHEVEIAASDPDQPPRCASHGAEHLAPRGVWLLRSKLGNGETCEAALRSVRQRLAVTLTLGCGG
jgi:hypothetical protein